MLKIHPTRRSVGVEFARLVTAALLATACHRALPETAGQRGFELRDGRWLGRDGFRAGTRWIVDARIATRRPRQVDSVIDLAGRWVVPPFGEAHNHNVDYSTPARTDSLIARYLRDGVFYVRNPGNLPRGRDSLAGRVNLPRGVDVVFANGLLTATGGHPTGLYRRNLARGAMTAADGEGAFFWSIDSLPDLERKWPRILAGRPDFIKVVLVHSEEFARRRTDTAYFNWRGIDPALVPDVVRRAHAAGLRVSAHVETATDFQNALVGGVDEINHIPGFRGDERVQFTAVKRYEVSEADAKLAAARGVWVVTTLGGISDFTPNGPDSLRRRQADALFTRNLRVLRDAGVRLAIGSDAYRDDSVQEVAYLASLGVFTPLQLLRLWSEATPQAIFPRRRVGCLEDGCEASLLVLAADPSVDVANMRRIALRMKDGRMLPCLDAACAGAARDSLAAVVGSWEKADDRLPPISLDVTRDGSTFRVRLRLSGVERRGILSGTSRDLVLSFVDAPGTASMSAEVVSMTEMRLRPSSGGEAYLLRKVR
jgi:imidazolonepropionase-like amidohydrolase